MHISRLHAEDKKALFDFERRNREWFEKSVPPRPSGYSEFATFSRMIDSLLEEQEAGTCLFHVIREGERIIGRANLVDISGGAAEIGYRVCESAAGRGAATVAVHFLIEQAAAGLSLRKLTAKTTTENPASRRVLEKCGFKQTGIVENGAVLNGRSVDFVCYERLLPKPVPDAGDAV